MEVQALVAAVGDDRFRSACAWAWRTAAGTGSATNHGSSAWPDDLGAVPHELADLWDEDDTPLVERLQTAQALYLQMPCYGLLMYVKHAYADFGPVELDVCWTEYRRLLEHEDRRLADPVGYSLWVDFFEDPATVERAWTEVTETTKEPVDAGPGRRIQRVLELSGPVPYVLKRGLYERLADDHRWHDHLARGLIGSAFDVYGDLDRADASTLLARLEVSADVSGLDHLRRRLGGGLSGA